MPATERKRVREMPEDECPDMQVLPLYAALSPELQARVFAPPPAGCRRVVVATNLAETSLTVPGVVFVVDPGFTKQNEYDPATGMDSLKVTSISAVQARQRAGRAGRTRAGRCFRLYTREHFELDMPTTTVRRFSGRRSWEPCSTSRRSASRAWTSSTLTFSINRTWRRWETRCDSCTRSAPSTRTAR